MWFRAGASHCEFGVFFFQALVLSILYTGLEALRLRHPDYEYLDRFVLGLRRDDQDEAGRWHRKIAHSRQKEGVGFPWPCPICHGTSRSSPSMVPEPYESPAAHQNVLFSFFGVLSSRIPFLTRTAGDANQHAGGLGNGRKTWIVSECSTMCRFS